MGQYRVIINCDKGKLAKCLREIAESVDDEEYLSEYWEENYYDVTIEEE